MTVALNVSTPRSVDARISRRLRTLDRVGCPPFTTRRRSSIVVRRPASPPPRPSRGPPKDARYARTLGLPCFPAAAAARPSSSNLASAASMSASSNISTAVGQPPSTIRTLSIATRRRSPLVTCPYEPQATTAPTSAHPMHRLHADMESGMTSYSREDIRPQVTGRRSRRMTRRSMLTTSGVARQFAPVDRGDTPSRSPTKCLRMRPASPAR